MLNCYFSHGYQFPPAAPGLAGCLPYYPYYLIMPTISIVDPLVVPRDLAPGDYVLSWRLVGPNLINFSSIFLVIIYILGGIRNLILKCGLRVPISKLLHNEKISSIVWLFSRFLQVRRNVFMTIKFYYNNLCTFSNNS